MATRPPDSNAQLATLVVSVPSPRCGASLGIRGSFFYGQECFKSGWARLFRAPSCPESLTKHDPAANTDGTYNLFPRYNFTGPMRPAYPFSSKRKILEHIQLPVDGIPKSEMRAAGQPIHILNAEEIEKMRTICRMSREILDLGAAAVRPGITTDEIDELVHDATTKRANFPKSVCTLTHNSYLFSIL
ncbi:hypothetical protein DFH09DRAFT_1360879 [Mycena vulgaris]|nr:hypothetical protein DFH09DRAFT_1360879 [Mycena vulgaris]